MKTLIKILGIAQDGGIPQIGCNCSNCQKPNNKNHLVTSLAIVQGQKFWLVDATPDIKDQISLLGENFHWSKPLNNLQGIFLTHAHMGHFTGLIQLGFESANIKNLPVFCTQKMRKFLIQNEPWHKMIVDHNLYLQAFDSSRVISEIRGIKILSFDVPHRNEFTDTVGFFIEGRNKNVFFLPDFESWDKCSDYVFSILKQSNICLLDGTFFTVDEIQIKRKRQHQEIGHPSIIQSIQFLQKIFPEKLPEIHFLHLNHTNPVVNEKSKEYIWVKNNGFKIAQENLEIILN